MHRPAGFKFTVQLAFYTGKREDDATLTKSFGVVDLR
jgi:hypothetical protein